MLPTDDRFVGYAKRQLPDDLDWEVFEALDAATNPDEQTPRSVTESEKDTLETFAERAATLAVRRQAPRLVELGLRALGIAGLGAGRRESLMILPLLHRAAQILGLDTRSIFLRAAKELGSPAAPILMSYANGQGQSVRAMGFEEVQTSEGFAFRYRS